VKRRLSHDVARYAPGLVIPIAVGTLSTVVFARIAAPDELGHFLVINALAVSVGVPAGQWLHQAVLRFYPTYLAEGRLAIFVRAVALLAVASGLLSGLIVASVLWWGFGEDFTGSGAMVAGPALAFFTTAGAGRTAVLQASFALGRYSLLNSAFAVLKFVLPLVLLSRLSPFAALVWGSALAALVAWVTLMLQHPNAIRGVALSISDQVVEIGRIGRQAMSFGGPLTLSEIGVQLLQFSDRFAIGAILGAAAVGLYGTNYSIAEKLVILVQAPLIYAAHSPIINAWERGDRRETISLLRTATRWLILFGAPIVAFSAVRGELISVLLLSEDYAPGHLVIPVAAASILLYAASQYGHKTFELGKQTWIITGGLIVAAALNIVGVVALTLRFGYMGGALGTAIGYAVYAVLIYVLSRRASSLFAWQVPWRTLAVGAVAGLVAAVVWAVLAPTRVYSLSDLIWLAGSGVMGLLAYAVVLLWARELPISMAAIVESSRRLRQPRTGQGAATGSG
jgi:O-antigen/teichoic acid export membrane protein